MARGPRVSGTVRNLVLTVFDDLWQRRGGPPDWLPTGVQVRGEVERRLEVQGRLDPAPSLRVVQLILHPVRERAWGMVEIDVPWSLAWGMQSPDPQIPEEAIPDLIELKRCSIITHRTFTVRQARWAVRLRLLPRVRFIHAWPFPHLLRAAELFEFSLELAGRHRRADLAETPLDTRDIEATIALDSHLYRAAVVSGQVPYYSVLSSIADSEEMTGGSHWGGSYLFQVLYQLYSGLGFEDDDDEGLAQSTRVQAALNWVSGERTDAVLNVWQFWLHELDSKGAGFRSWRYGIFELSAGLLEGIVDYEGRRQPWEEESKTTADFFEYADRFPKASNRMKPYIPYDFFSATGYDPSNINEEAGRGAQQ